MKINYDDLATYFRILYTHINAGNSVVKALSLLEKSSKNKALRLVSEYYTDEVQSKIKGYIKVVNITAIFIIGMFIIISLLAGSGL